MGTEVAANHPHGPRLLRHWIDARNATVQTSADGQHHAVVDIHRFHERSVDGLPHLMNRDPTIERHTHRAPGAEHQLDGLVGGLPPAGLGNSDNRDSTEGRDAREREPSEGQHGTSSRQGVAIVVPAR